MIKKAAITIYKAAEYIDRKFKDFVNNKIIYPIVRGPVGDFAEWATKSPARLATVSLGIGATTIAIGTALVGGVAAVQAAISGVMALGTYARITLGAVNTAFLTNMYAHNLYQVALKNTLNQTALIELAKMEQMKGGTDIQTAQTLISWAQEYGVSYANHLGGHAGRGTLPHIEIGSVNHIFVNISKFIK